MRPRKGLAAIEYLADVKMGSKLLAGLTGQLKKKGFERVTHAVAYWR